MAMVTMMAHIAQKCNFCEHDAVYDGKTTFGPWAYMCENCFTLFGIKKRGLFKELPKPAAVIQHEGMHSCIACGCILPVEDFDTYVDKQGKERYMYLCRKCAKRIE